MRLGLVSQEGISFGVRFRLSAETQELLEAMWQSAPFGATECALSTDDAAEFAVVSARAGAGYRLLIENELAGEFEALEPALDRLGGEVMVYVANHAPDSVFVHAGVVAWQGSALILPGTSFAGKTTLVAALVRAGAVYYSDEYAVIDATGKVHPYARDLQMRKAGGEEQRRVNVADLQGTAGDGPLPVRWVVFTEYMECGWWRPEGVSSGAAVLEMMQHSIAVQRTPARVMEVLARMMEGATAVRSVRGEAGEMARVLLDAMSCRFSA